MIKYLILLILSVYSYNIAPISMDKSFIGAELCIAILSLFLFFKETKSLVNEGKFYLRHSYFFIFVFCIVFYQYYIDFTLGFLDGSENKIWISNNIVCKSIALVNISLQSFIIGYFSYSKKKIRNIKESEIFIKRVFKSKKILCYSAYLLFGYFLLTVDNDFFYGGYVKSGGQTDSNFAVIVILQSLFIAILVLYSIEYKENNRTNILRFFKLPFILIISYCMIVILCGRRTEVLRVLTMLIVCIVYIKGNKLNYKKMFLAGFSLILFFSLFGIIRSDDSANLASGFDVLKYKSSIFPPTQELAGSINTLHIATFAIPESIPYNYGVTFFPSFTLLIPGLDRLCNMMIPKELMVTSPTFITRLYWGDNVAYGLGSSLVADIYISFGVIGLIFIFFLLARLLKFLEISTFIIHSGVSPYVLALSFCVFSQITYSMRTGVSVLFLSWTYSCIIIFIVQKIKYFR